MSRTRSLGETTQRAIRLPVTLLERLERHAERMRGRNPGLSISVADAVRTLLTAALDREEAAEPEPERESRPASKPRRGR